MPRIDLSTVSLAELPVEEDDAFEFKSSLDTSKEIKKKISKAGSGFANSGGGCFVWGIADDGNADGGIEENVGNQGLRDWLDQSVASIAPVPKYEIQLFNDSAGRGHIETGKCVAAVSFFPSELAPH
jgi:predicted HTH transcriptional regulator